MQAKVVMTLTRDEVQQIIPYAMICETRYGRLWGTTKRLRSWRTQFTPQERVDAETLFRLSHTWYLVKGVPDSIEMTTRTLALWKKIEDFCATL